MPDHDRIEPEPVGDHVDEPLAHKARLETSRCAIGTARRLVGKPHVADERYAGIRYGPGSIAAGEVGDDNAVRTKIGSLVEPELVVEAQNEAVLIDRRAHAMDRACGTGLPPPDGRNGPRST